MSDVNPIPQVSGGAAGKSKYIGVPNDYTVAPTLGDQFRPGGHYDQVAAGPGMAREFLPLDPSDPNYGHDPKYAPGNENEIGSLSTEALARLQVRMSRAGLISPTTHIKVGVADNATIAAYKNLLGIANRYAVSQLEALTMLESQPTMVDGKLIGKDSGPSSSTRTDTSTTSFTPLDAEAAADNAYQQALGQDSSPRQQKALRAALNAYAAAHPTISTTQSQYDAEGTLTSTNTSTKGGIDAAGVQQIGLDQARSAPDYAEIQASSTYKPIIDRLLSARANVG